MSSLRELPRALSLGSVNCSIDRRMMSVHHPHTAQQRAGG
jgi:hypothetical protein